MPQAEGNKLSVTEHRDRRDSPIFSGRHLHSQGVDSGARPRDERRRVLRQYRRSKRAFDMLSYAAKDANVAVDGDECHCAPAVAASAAAAVSAATDRILFGVPIVFKREREHRTGEAKEAHGAARCVEKESAATRSANDSDVV